MSHRPLTNNSSLKITAAYRAWSCVMQFMKQISDVEGKPSRRPAVEKSAFCHSRQSFEKISRIRLRNIRFLMGFRGRWKENV
jgi:hypothetical protein